MHLVGYLYEDIQIMFKIMIALVDNTQHNYVYILQFDVLILNCVCVCVCAAVCGLSLEDIYRIDCVITLLLLIWWSWWNVYTTQALSTKKIN